MNENENRKDGQPEPMTLGEALRLCQSNALREAAAVCHATFDGLPPERAQIIRAMIDFFNAAASAYDAASRGDLSTIMKALLPGAYAECAMEKLRGIQSLLVRIDRPNDRAATLDYLERTRQWLREKGWVLIPRDIEATRDSNRTAAGIYADMEQYAQEADAMRATMAQTIAAAKGGKR